MRGIGEKKISAIPLTHRTKGTMSYGKVNGKKDVRVTCPNAGCGKDFYTTGFLLEKYGKGLNCWDCHTNGPKELNQALINLAKRKLEIKGGKK